MLRKKVLLQIIAIELVILCLFLACFAAIYRNYQQLEQKTLATHLERAQAALQRDVTTLENYSRLWARRGALHQTIDHPTRINVWLRGIYTHSMIGAFRISGAFLLDHEGNLLVGRGRDSKGDAQVADESHPLFAALSEKGLLQPTAGIDDNRRGLVAIGEDIYVVSYEPIASGLDLDNLRGALVVLALFDEDWKQQLEQDLQQGLHLHQLSRLRESLDKNSPLEQSLSALLASPGAGESLYLPASDELMYSYAVLEDAGGEPSFVLQLENDRDLVQQAEALWSLGASLLGGLVLLGIYVLWFLDRSILSRLKSLNGNVLELTASDDKSARLKAAGKDELSLLATAFNGLLDSLQFTQQCLREERDRAETTLASIGDAVITTDLAGNIQYLNRAAEQLTGHAIETCAAKALLEVFNPRLEAGGEAIDFVAECLRTGESVRESACYLTGQDLSEIVIDTLACPIFDCDNKASGAVIVFRDVSKERRLQKRLQHQASHDDLTKLLNRAEFEKHLASLSNLVTREGRAHHVLFVDLDRFKVANDSCGHVAGDNVLREAARLMRPLIRGSDVLARIGGDEFGVILFDCTADRAYRIAESIREVIADYRFVYKDKFFTFGASIGLVEASASEDETGAGILSLADRACMEAKNSGRNRVHRLRPKDSRFAEHAEQTQWVGRITDALERDQFVLFYQLIEPVDKSRAVPARAEILLRMIGPDQSTIAPGAFLPAAERYGLMKLIDKWVIEQFCQWLSANSHVFAKVSTFAINLSGQSLSDDLFLDYLVGYFEKMDISPERLCFEITETAAIRNIANASHFITTLKERGFSFSLDDFGSGMSSFSYLKNLPIDSLKIDGAFVKNLDKSDVDCSLVRSINDIGHVMGLKTVAEFVENEEILKKLKELKVDYAQGYHLHKPAHLSELSLNPAMAGQPETTQRKEA